MVTPAVAALSSRLLDVAATEQDPVRVANALTRLHALVFFDLLPHTDRPRVVAIAQALLAGAHAPAVWLAALELAVATGDEHLRTIVEGIGSGAIRPRFAEREDLTLLVCGVAQRALVRAGDWSRLGPRCRPDIHPPTAQLPPPFAIGT